MFCPSACKEQTQNQPLPISQAIDKCIHHATLNRSSMRDISSDFEDEDLADKPSSARRNRASFRKEKSRREQASRRSVPRYMSIPDKAVQV